MTDDTRVTCNTCRNLRNGWCSQAERARIGVGERIEIAPDLAGLPQHCPAHAPRAHALPGPAFPATNDHAGAES